MLDGSGRYDLYRSDSAFFEDYPQIAQIAQILRFGLWGNNTTGRFLLRALRSSRHLSANGRR